ncbi:hypothetical protein BK722_18765 [Bacillus thuringiensis serovar finitimus]|nr:hypothetical protein YBT020_07025 [Bacillus thuringiensis serovar finitimus YBT-020]OTX68661.1 hypothetical protein BK722_18765 [Bacillus thuringiensis serovar finitimus]
MQTGRYILFTIYLKSCITEIQDYFTPLFAGSKIPAQNSAKAKNSGGRSTARKSPIGSTNNQWGMKTPH